MIYKLEAPWYTYQKKVKAIFEHDPEITVGEIVQNENGTGLVFGIEVRNHEKYLALDRVLRRKQTFGNITLTIDLYDEENEEEEEDEAISLYRTIFKGNPIVEDVADIVDPAGIHHGYVVFRPEVIQFQTDDLTDIFGNWSGLAQNIAREIFDDVAHGLNFCTGKVHNDELPQA